MDSNVIPFFRSRLKELESHWKVKHGGGNALAGLVLDLSLELQKHSAGETIADGFHPYAEVFACRGWSARPYYMINIHCWAFIVDEWKFYEPQDANLKPLLLHEKGRRVMVPWAKLMAKPRGIGINDCRTWHGKINTETEYWLKLEEMLLADIHTRHLPFSKDLKSFRRPGKNKKSVNKKINDLDHHAIRKFFVERGLIPKNGKSK